MDLSVVCLLMLVLVCHGAGLNDKFQKAKCKKHGPAIKFPFRLDKQPEYCGYPGFVLSCNQRNETLLQLPNSVTLNIKEIDYASRLIIAGFAADPDNCLPRQLRNFSLSQSPFKFAAQYQDDRLCPFQLYIKAWRLLLADTLPWCSWIWYLCL